MPSAPSPEWVAALDRRAFDACQGWFHRHPSDVLIHRGVHLGELMRQHLWSKVGRALRWQNYPDSEAFELSWLRRERRFLTWGRDPASQPDARGAPVPLAVRRVKRWGRRTAQGILRVLDRRNSVLVPLLRKTGPRLLAALEQSPKLRLVSYPDDAPRFSLRAIGEIDPPPPPTSSRLKEMQRLVVAGLAAEGVDLLPMDQESLPGELAREWSRVDQITELLERVRPSAIVLQTDDVSPPLCYVLAARRLGIPAIAFKHGLDCEHHFHSQAYADAIMVWGPARAERYRHESVWQPRRIEVTGNPEYADVRSPESLRPSGADWLWVTRPHDPMKCYAPSRRADEGVLILTALLDLLRDFPDTVRLVVKPHPTDLVEAYRELLAERGDGRVTIEQGPLGQALERASLVLSEDSTAALDAMLYGRPLVLVHFAPSAPVLPLTEYGAAYPGFDSRQLRDSITRIMTQSPAEAVRMWEGQQAFIRDFAGPLDGRQPERALEFVLSVLGQQ